MSDEHAEDTAPTVPAVASASRPEWVQLRTTLLDALPATSSPNGDLHIEIRFDADNMRIVTVAPARSLGLDLLELRCDVHPAAAIPMEVALSTNATLAFPGLALLDGRYVLRYTALAESLDASAVTTLARCLAASADVLGSSSHRTP
jgi:hypothetical protein